MRFMLISILLVTVAGCTENESAVLEDDNAVLETDDEFSAHYVRETSLGIEGLYNHRVARTVEDNRPPLSFDRSKPFVLEFGRGSGLHGLETIRINAAGLVNAYRRKFPQWETTSFTLGKAEMSSVLDLIEKHHLLSLKRAYHADVLDGTQWVFCLKQGDRRKAVYFNNTFPKEILGFAIDIDATLNLSARNLEWTTVDNRLIRHHATELWDSIKD